MNPNTHPETSSGTNSGCAPEGSAPEEVAPDQWDAGQDPDDPAEYPDEDSARASLHERFRRLQRLTRRRHMAAHHGGPFADTTRGRGRVLAALRMQSPIPTRELAFLLDIRQQSLNELLKKLEADGLVERRPSEEDRRVMVVHLTQAGRGTPLGGAHADYLNVLTDEEAATLAGLLDKVIDSLEAQLGTDAGAECGPRFDEVRRRMGAERFEAMMRMREHGFGPFGPGFGPGGPGGPGFGPEADDAFAGEGPGGRGGRRGHGGHGGRGAHGGPRRGGRPGGGVPGFPGEDFPERGARGFRPGRRGHGHPGRGARTFLGRFGGQDY
ncbi:MarR family transcriptional regulator [uncultured Actinomyces sp.]|uniref:MarR family winged helix-turn-helix transcriptional regulator n=1 Tax=uncultured Actinomyces sp. TaxID=249061 RepID=UPI0028E74C25|nr:MarR family transcriptional regulator [uncultured Actinomyces sp.]